MAIGRISILRQNLVRLKTVYVYSRSLTFHSKFIKGKPHCMSYIETCIKRCDN